MKTLKLLCLVMLIAGRLLAQKVSYNSGVIQVDGKDLAKVVKIKEDGNFGLTSSYEVDAISGEKLIMASFDSDFPVDKNDNSRYFYKVEFLTTNQEAVFGLSVFGPEKSFAKLIGGSGIIVNDKLDSNKVKLFIALKAQKPPVPKMNTQLYDIVDRYTGVIVILEPDLTINQDGKIIGRFKDVSTDPNQDTYQFTTPEGLVIATASFTGGTKATKFNIATLKDGSVHTPTIPVGNSRTIISSVDRNESTILRIANWLINNNFL